MEKKFFPFKEFRSIEDTNKEGPPVFEDFELDGVNLHMSDGSDGRENFEAVMKVWRDNDMVYGRLVKILQHFGCRAVPRMRGAFHQ